MKRFLHLGWLGLIALVHCSSEDEKACTPGQQISCPCSGPPTGVQACLSDGSGYGKCDCSVNAGGTSGTSGAGGNDASAGSSGTTGSGGSTTGGSAGNAGSSSGGVSGSGGASGGAGGTAGGDASGAAGTGGTGGTNGSGGAGGTGGAAGASDGGTTCAAGTVTNAVQDECDPITQDCPTGSTCTIQQGDGGTYRTRCVDYGNGTAQLGELCSTHADCADGLRCTQSRCTRPCCPAVESQVCGPYGSCTLQVNFGSTFLRVCTFAFPCTPWANDCPAGPETDCHLLFGELSCFSPTYSADAGATIGQPCVYQNDCQDSQVCRKATSSDPMGTCRWMCKVSANGAPDAGTVGGTPGQGGCLTGQTCTPYVSPSWLGFCAP